MIKSIPLNKRWKSVEGLKEDWLGCSMNVGGWGRMIDDRHVVVLLNRCGDYHPSWRLYVDGVMVLHMKNIVVMMGSGSDAMEQAAAYMKSKKMKAVIAFAKKLEEAMGGV